MLLKTVFVRFYKSFNFDYLRKYSSGVERRPWEMIDEMWYPFVRVPIDSHVTTIVGANESGKSHLLTAIEKGTSGTEIEREDFCRYSQFFKVERGEMKWPDFGFEWSDLSTTDQELVRNACKIADGTIFDHFLLFRTARDLFTIYIRDQNKYLSYELDIDASSKFRKLLPRIFRIDANVALPDSVSIKGLAKGSLDSQSSRLETMNRRERFGSLEAFARISLQPDWFTSPEAVAQHAALISPAISPLLNTSGVSTIDSDQNEAKRKAAEFRLAYDLICKVANVDPEALAELYRALRNGKEGHANGIIQEINNRLEATLNFPHWWVQDRNFRLIVSPREFDLVFTIRDRTETDYSFGERSSGLKYFLSYYVQYRAHESRDDTLEILLMDEPDAYLSSQAQQDLLKIFDAFAFPNDDRRPVQVIYVTHSPFLIDKNHAERIRVLEKGVGDEGTRVVKDAAKNHYEPLRSAFGAFVGETTFIGNCNLMVEGQADQILLAGTATYLRRRKVAALETLDLNRVTIVPAGSASHIPYLVYLARGRDIEQPAVIVLLDSDQSGDDARKRLRKGGAYDKQLLKDNFVLQVGSLVNEEGLSLARKGALVEMEDLIPLSICAEAARRYVREVCGATERDVDSITEKALTSKLTKGASVFHAVEALLTELTDDGYHIEKVGFARYVVEIVSKQQPMSDELTKGVESFEKNMRILFRHLDKIRREAERELIGERVSHKINRLKNSFLQDHPVSAKREDAHVLFDDIDAALDDGPESDAVKITILGLRRTFEVDEDMTQPIDEYKVFKEALEKIKYAGRIATQESDINAPDSLPETSSKSITAVESVSRDEIAVGVSTE